METSTLAYIVIVLALVIIADKYGYIRLSRRRYLGEHEGKLDVRLIHPTLGTLTVVGGREVGGETFPITKEFGYDTIVPIPMKLYETVFPANPSKFMTGDPDGMVLNYVDENDPNLGPMKMQIENLKKQNTLLLLRNDQLETDNLKMSSEYTEKIRQEAERMGAIKRQIAQYIPPEAFKKGYSGGYND